MPGHEMPYSVSIPMTRCTVMPRAYGPTAPRSRAPRGASSARLQSGDPTVVDSAGPLPSLGR